jgi:hypothetical protein
MKNKPAKKSQSSIPLASRAVVLVLVLVLAIVCLFQARRHHQKVVRLSRHSTHFVTGVPDHGPEAVFGQDPDEPIQTVYDVMAWVHGQGGGRVQVEPHTLGKGKHRDYLGCDPGRAHASWWARFWDGESDGRCYSDVYVTVKNQ